MNINSISKNISVNFNGIKPNDISLTKLVNTFPASDQFIKNLANGYNYLKESEAVDLSMKESGDKYDDICIITKKTFLNNNNEEIPVGTTIKVDKSIEYTTMSNEGELYVPVKIGELNKQEILKLDLRNKDYAQDIQQDLMPRRTGYYSDVLPTLAKAMTSSDNLQSLKKGREIFSKKNKE